MGRRRAQAGAERESPGAIGEVVNRAAEATGGHEAGRSWQSRGRPAQPAKSRHLGRKGDVAQNQQAQCQQKWLPAAQTNAAQGGDEAPRRGGTGPVVRPRTWAYRPCTSAMKPYAHHAPSHAQDAAREYEGVHGKVSEGIRLPPSGVNEGSKSQPN
ncbi:hypothetical protein V6N12_028951 [Hibiscus sabdariffa]|uniref:Uncharacterized protein n=1 Tax=Hibiscus sabdariffa TaxID=183260 RepID=A0ABR2F7B7_9ROSI